MTQVSTYSLAERIRAVLSVICSVIASLAFLVAVPSALAYVPYASVALAAALWTFGHRAAADGKRPYVFGLPSAGSAAVACLGTVLACHYNRDLSRLVEWQPKMFSIESTWAMNMWGLAGAAAGVLLWEAAESFGLHIKARHALLLEGGMPARAARQRTAARLGAWLAAALACAATPYAPAGLLLLGCLYSVWTRPYGRELSRFMAWSCGLAIPLAVLLGVGISADAASRLHPAMPLLFANLVALAGSFLCAAILAALVVIMRMAAADCYHDALKTSGSSQKVAEQP